MEQFHIAETIKDNNNKTTATFAVFMASFVVTVVQVAPTLMILAAPALLMNLGWLIFARSV
jgi:cytochrome c oxidase assembly factor CtaG